ncbi:ABC transporter ATP-binding protein [Methanomassiliicoccaceae archaeon COG_1]|nr:ABC transporter ATP-binding protein [Methanomassiliicoccaceae archaeon COG_1]
MVGPRETSSHGAATQTSPWPPPSAINRLSGGGGEAQKVAIGRAMAQETSVLLLDEPTSNLDLRNQLEVLDIIREMAADRGVAAIVTMHDLNLALRFADKFILMRGGTIWDMGGREIITAENIKSVYSVDVTVAEVNGRPVIVPV